MKLIINKNFYINFYENYEYMPEIEFYITNKSMDVFSITYRISLEEILKFMADISKNKNAKHELIIEIDKMNSISLYHHRNTIKLNTHLYTYKFYSILTINTIPYKEFKRFIAQVNEYINININKK